LEEGNEAQLKGLMADWKMSLMEEWFELKVMPKWWNIWSETKFIQSPIIFYTNKQAKCVPMLSRIYFESKLGVSPW